MLWTILGSSVVMLSFIYFRKGGNAVWGGLTIGSISGFITAIVLAFMGKGSNRLALVKIATLATIIGFIAELLRR